MFEPTLLYIDPGSGSILLQALVAAIAGFGVVLKFGWRRVLGFFGIKRKEKDQEE